MKTIFVVVAAILATFIFVYVLASTPSIVVVSIEGQDAKKIYNTLTGKLIQQDGATGHLYRKGKNITCVYVDVDMDDNKGKNIPNDDSRRYRCVIQVDKNGIISSVMN